MAPKIEVLLYGPGAIGAFYAFILQRSPRVRLSVVARSSFDAIKANGITIKTANHGDHVFHPAQTLRKPEDAKSTTFDYIVIVNKAINQERVTKDLAAVVDEKKTTIALMQNGVGIEDPYRKAFPNSTILSGVVWVGGTELSPGVVQQRSSENTEIGLFESKHIDSTRQNENLDTFVSLFREGGTTIEVLDHIQTARWKKTIWNMAWNSLTTLTASDTASWLSSSELAVPLTRRLMTEAIDVAKALKIPDVDYDLIDVLLERINKIGGIYSSMYYDSKAGRPMEVEAIMGTAVRKGRELGVSIPTLEIIYSLLLAIDARMEKERAGK